MSIAKKIKQGIEDNVMMMFSDDPSKFEAVMIDLACLFQDDYLDDDKEYSVKREIESKNLTLDLS